jgi:hypothetical protein
MSEELTSRPVKIFLDEFSSSSPAPSGGRGCRSCSSTFLTHRRYGRRKSTLSATVTWVSELQVQAPGFSVFLLWDSRC